MKKYVLRRLYLYCSMIFLSVSLLSGCDTIYGILQKEGAQEKDLLGDIVPYEYNEKVAEVQKLLKLYGYKIGRVDGLLGGNTRDAIQSFQQDNGLKESRFIDQKTWDQLNIFTRYNLVQEGELNISMIQQVLKSAGENPGPADGKLGPRTIQSIKDFQKAEGLKADGKVGFRTLSKMLLYVPENEY